MAKHWIAGATANAHGQFAAKAKRAGMSTRAYAAKEAHAPGKTGAQARLAKRLMSFHPGEDGEQPGDGHDRIQHRKEEGGKDRPRVYSRAEAAKAMFPSARG